MLLKGLAILESKVRDTSQRNVVPAHGKISRNEIEIFKLHEMNQP